MSSTPEQDACIEIDRMLAEAGWLVQDVKRVNLHAGRGVAVHEFPLERGFGLRRAGSSKSRTLSRRWQRCMWS